MDDEMRDVVGTPGEVARLVGAYRRAVWAAETLRAVLVAAGLDPAEVVVVPGLDDESGDAAVHVTVLPVVAAQLGAIAAEDDAGGRRPSGRRGGRVRLVIRPWRDRGGWWSVFLVALLAGGDQLEIPGRGQIGIDHRSFVVEGDPVAPAAVVACRGEVGDGPLGAGGKADVPVPEPSSAPPHEGVACWC
ncbi:MAG: hypothetical protein ACRDTE_23750 [Pseudonocardiaceae bacterium]